MSYDAKKAAYQEVTILGRPALFAECRIDNSTVPKGLYRYELRHGDENWGDPVSLSRNIIVNYYGAVLTREPFQLPIEGWILLEDDSLSFQDGGCRTLAEFQRKYPVSKKDVIDFFVANDDSLHDFYFSHSEAQDKATGCVGHLRGDFGSGKQFFTTWWPHQGDQLNTPAFKADIDRAVNWLREQPDSPLHDFDTMKRFCGRFERSCAIKGAMLPSYAFMAKTKQYVYTTVLLSMTPKRANVSVFTVTTPTKWHNNRQQLLRWSMAPYPQAARAFLPFWICTLLKLICWTMAGANTSDRRFSTFFSHTRASQNAQSS